MIGAQLLALRIAYVIKLSHKNRLTISEAKLRLLAEKEVLSIFYLADLKRSLEELGYFLGSLKKGKYCLLVIESLEGAPSLPLKEETMKQLTPLSEDALEKLCVTPAAMEMITENEQDETMLLLNELWRLLNQIATEKASISYGELAKSLTNVFSYKVHHKKVMALLERIKQYCSENSLPKLDYLAINAKLDLPKALEKEQDAEIKFAEEKAKIYDFDWRTIVNPFADEDNKLDKSSQAEPPLLLEDLSSKESATDDTSNNEPTDEALRAKTPIIRHGNETGIGAEENRENVKKEVFHKPIWHSFKTISITRKQKTFIKSPHHPEEQK